MIKEYKNGLSSKCDEWLEEEWDLDGLDVGMVILVS